MALLGRTAEQTVLSALLDSAAMGVSGTLVVRGEAGIGKTALLDDAVARASESGFQATRLTGIESESHLSYAALHLLLRDFLPRLATLPKPQSEAIGAAFGIESDVAPDRFLIGLAALTLLSDVARQSPLLCVVDDAQWLDQESADLLAFVARRLHADAVAMLFAVRESDQRVASFEGLPELVLSGLPEDQALDLLSAATSTPIDPTVGRQIVAETQANPLALLEIGDDLTAEQLAGTEALPKPLPLGPRLEEVFLNRVRTLPTASQTFLLIAAVDTSDDVELIWRAAGLLGLEKESILVAELDRLLVIDTEVRFRHPLVRSAVYHGAHARERRRIYAALADADEDDADRQVWNRASAAPGVDEAIASELERMAQRTSARGGYAANAGMLVRAVELTADREKRPTRLLAAAGATLAAGNTVTAESLLARAEPELEAPLERAHCLRLRAGIRFAKGEGGEPYLLLMRAAEAFGSLDQRLARDALFDAFEVATWTSREATIEVARAVRAGPTMSPAVSKTTDFVLEAFATRMLDGFVPAVPQYRNAISALLAESSDLRGFNLGSIAAGDMWDLDAYQAVTNRWVQLARSQGALGSVALGTLMQSAAEHLRGRFTIAKACNAEAVKLSDETTGILGSAGQADEVALAWTGPEADAREAVDRHLHEALQRDQGAHGRIVPEFAASQLALGLGDYAAAATSAERVFAADFIGPASAWGLSDLVEACQRSGNGELGSTALEVLRQRALACNHETALGLLARSDALFSDDEHAEAFFCKAIEHFENSPALPDLARAHLVYGEWLRRQRRRLNARDELRTALALFDTIGAKIFARRASVELAATGERARPRTPNTQDELTPQEIQVAQLAAEGATDREIASKLFISTSTVDYHLRKVFRKVGVSSRTQLAREMASQELRTLRHNDE